MAKSQNTTNHRSKPSVGGASERTVSVPHSPKAPATPAGSSKKVATTMETQTASILTNSIVPASAKRNSPSHKFERNDDGLLRLCQEWHALNAECVRAERASEKLKTRNTPAIPASIRRTKIGEYGLSLDDGETHITARSIESRIHQLTVKGTNTVLEDSRDSGGLGRLVMAFEFAPGAFSLSDAFVSDLQKLLAIAKDYEAKVEAARVAHWETVEHKKCYRLRCKMGDLAEKKIARLRANTPEGVLEKIGVLKTMCPDLLNDRPETDLLASVIDDAQRVLAKPEGKYRRNS